MEKIIEIQEKLNSTVQLGKANLKLCRGMVDYISQNSISTDKKIDALGKKLDELKQEIRQLGKLRAEEHHVYSDEEIYKLKESLTWKQLHRKTKIPLSTLQYRRRRYIKDILDFEEDEL